MVVHHLPRELSVVSVDDLNAMDEDAFTAALAGVFEHSPHIARRASTERPFESRAALVRALAGVVDRLDGGERVALLRAHPRLGSRRPMAERSVAEQAGAGLDALDAERDRRLLALNDTYEERFGFPFVVAVRGLSPADVLDRLEERLGHDRAGEVDRAIAEVVTIAGFRLDDLVTGP
jgi:OHCU decarboxylase